MTEQVNTYSGQRANNVPPRGYPWVDVTHEGNELANRTIDAIMADVGDSAELARAAMAAEKARADEGLKPRVTLIARLQEVIDADE